MEKKNGLRVIKSLGLKDEEVVELIILRMAIDHDLSTFIIEQTRFMLFTGQGKCNPSEEELTDACMVTIVSTAINIEGAIVAYDVFLKEGLDAYLDIMRKVLYNEKVG